MLKSDPHWAHDPLVARGWIRQREGILVHENIIPTQAVASENTILVAGVAGVDEPCFFIEKSAQPLHLGRAYTYVIPLSLALQQ